jgi:hypothetical protein
VEDEVAGTAVAGGRRRWRWALVGWKFVGLLTFRKAYRISRGGWRSPVDFRLPAPRMWNAEKHERKVLFFGAKQNETYSSFDFSSFGSLYTTNLPYKSV